MKYRCPNCKRTDEIMTGFGPVSCRCGGYLYPVPDRHVIRVVLAVVIPVAGVIVWALIARGW